MAEEDTKSCSFNVGGCFYSIPISRLSCFQESLLLKESVFNDHARLFLDRDGFTFRHLHYYIHTGKLATSCISEINILYELASTLRLASLQQALENRQSGKHFLRARPVDLQVTERATMYYWKTRLCNPKQPESVASPVFTVHDAIPLGLVGKPLVDTEDEVMYCFIPLEQLRLHPSLVTQDNLLWLCDDTAVIECGSRLFRFIANFLRTGKILLPEHFGDYELLSSEAKMVGMTEFMETLQEQCELNSNSPSVLLDTPQMSGLESVARPLYIMTFDLLVKYPDSSLGQLHIDSNLEGSRLYVTGSGVVFQHVQDWLGTCSLPLTEEASQLSGVCEYLERQDGAYQAFKEALFQFLQKRKTSKSVFTAKPWSASVAACTVYKIVKVYVGTHWYATYLQTLLKYPELLSNSSKVNWICFGQSLHVKGDGQIFRHILNFLRSGRLLLPADFREWPLLCQEVEAFQIPALTGALEDCSDYRAWCRGKGHSSDGSSSSSLAASLSLDEDRFLGISSDEESMDFSEQDTLLRESPDYSYLLMGDSSSRPNSEEPIVVSLPINHSPSKSKNLGQAQGVFPGLSETSREKQACNAGPSTGTGNSVSNAANTASATDDLSSSIRSLLQKIRGTCLKSLLQRLSSNIPASTQQRVAPAHRAPQESIPKERLVQILEETFRSQPNLKIKKLPRPTSPCGTGHSAGSSDSSLLARDSESAAGGEEWSWTGLPLRGCVLQVTHLPVLGRGEPGGFFTHSVIYTGTHPDSTAHPHVTATATGDPRDVAFAHFNLSYEEMVYGREGHAFLTGIILDSKRLDTAHCTQNLANLIYRLWTDQINTEDSLQELLGLIGVKLHKNREKLQQWLNFTLPLARRYAECLMLLERHCCQTETLFP
ncbi:BTB/POZ domain-containing protein KCTD19-like [Sardina pilchardus]|uniref:BTB/POZ domain-containing protein KCTD19-like n=1 Tax=Sardina pilchardus TaxID=27697 RepID=UPI002E141A08